MFQTGRPMIMSEDVPGVSVIMRTKNADWVVEETLKGLFSQKYNNFELLVVDSGSTDNTLDIVKKYPARIMEIEPKAYFPGTVLNQAIEQTSGEIVVFLNSDAVPQNPYALTRLIAAFDKLDVQAAFARQTPRPEANAWVKRDYARSFPEEGPAPPWITLSLPMAAMRRSIWEKRPFYTAAWASEDTEWGHWAQAEGHVIKYVPDALVMHSHNYTLRQTYGRRFVEGEADVFIYGGRATFCKMLSQWLRVVVQDSIWCLRKGAFNEIPAIPLRRLVYSWAYRAGHKLGEERKKKDEKDASRGQEVVLARHE
ncbi:glycosyltransferase [Candidatus Hydrogenedentota bacterium]